MLCSDHFLCLPESAEPYENKNSESLIFLFFPSFESVLSNISENGFSFLPAGTTGLTWVVSATACKPQVSLLQLDLCFLRLGREQKGIAVATMAFLYSSVTSIPYFMVHVWAPKAQPGLFRPQGIGQPPMLVKQRYKGSNT